MILNVNGCVRTVDASVVGHQRTQLGKSGGAIPRADAAVRQHAARCQHMLVIAAQFPCLGGNFDEPFVDLRRRSSKLADELFGVLARLQPLLIGQLVDPRVRAREVGAQIVIELGQLVGLGLVTRSVRS